MVLLNGSVFTEIAKEFYLNSYFVPCLYIVIVFPEMTLPHNSDLSYRLNHLHICLPK